MKTSSAKAKGRRLAASVKEALLTSQDTLQDADIAVTPSGVTGEDLWLSPAARLWFPFIIECKNQEKLSIWEALKQAESHKKEGDKRVPLLCFSRNRSDTYVALKLSDLLNLIKK